jgi:hypothetical protein
MQNARERGIGGSGLELQNQLMQEQAAADQASRAGTDIAAQAQARALASLQAAGQLGGQMQAQQYGEQANKATSQNAIDKFNAETQGNTNLYNVGTSNQAQAANLAAKQAVMNANTETGNTQEMYNAQQNQTRFQDEMAKASGKAGTLNQWASDASAQAAKEAGADMVLTGGLLNAGASLGATALGGPVAGAAVGAGSIVSTPQFGTVKNASNKDIFGYNCGGTVKSMKEGGKVPGQPEVPGDSPKNDTVPAMLSPGEVVIPRSKVNDEEEFDKFMKEVRMQNMAKGGMVKSPMPTIAPPQEVPSPMPVAPAPQEQSPDMIGTVLKSLQQRVTNLEGGR